jgi:tetratricopeptide (TPR) repeat protein
MKGANMGSFSRKEKGSVPGKGPGGRPSGGEPYRVPSDSELRDKLRDIEEVNARIAGDPRMQEVMREMLGQEPAETPQPRMEQVRENLKAGGLSYIASPPADFPEVAPEAHKLWLGEALLASMLGDDARCLSAFNQALEITRRKGHKTGEARLLYNIGVAHYKLGDLDKAIEILLEGKALTEGLASELGREARKVQRFEEEVKTDDPRVDVLGVPHMEQHLLEMYLEALATVYEADSQAGKAAECRNEIKRLYRQGT